MAKKKKGELPSGNVRRLVYNGMKQKKDKEGNPMFDEFGKPIMIRDYISVTASNATEANQLKTDVKASSRYKTPRSELTISEAIDEILSSTDAILSPTTVNGYRVMQRNGFQKLMHAKLKDITIDMLTEAVNEEAKRPAKKGKNTTEPISPKTIKNEWGLMTLVLNKYRKDLDLSEVRLPQQIVTIKTLPTPEVIFEAIKGEPIELAAILAMWLSFTESEIRGIKKSTSVKDGYITIEEVIVKAGNKTVVKKQTKEVTRTRRHRIPEYIQMLIDKTDPNEDRLVPLSGQAMYQQFTRLLKRKGLPHMTFHDLRHVNASVMAKLNVPTKYALERGGWATNEVMDRVYTHTFSADRVAVDDTIDNYFNHVVGIKKKEAVSYLEFLTVLDLKDNDEIKELYEKYKMQHEMQHGNKKAQ